jgi:lysophospholipase L1-like esterase
MRVRLVLGLLAAVAGLAACGSSSSSGSSRPSSPASSTPATYYVSVGDSLAVGVQPDKSGNSLRTNEGYADDLYQSVRSSRPGLQLVKLGCPGETTETMTRGGICRYGQGSQMAAATAFLQAHQGSVAFLTIDMGANDVDACAPGGNVDVNCVLNGFSRIKTQLPNILQQLRTAGGPQLRIVGMNLYDPFLAMDLNGPSGQSVSNLSLTFAGQLNGTFASIYQAAGDPMADVAGAFATTDTTPTALAGHGTVPTNVARICQWTWMCAAKPVGPNIHANATGYQMIAGAFRPLI